MSGETEIRELTISEIVQGGAGLAREPGEPVVIIPGTAPGDRVLAELAPLRKRFRKGRVLEVIESGPGRRSPACPEAGTCGGCQWQHLEPSSQADAASGMLRAALRRVGRLESEGVEIPPPRRLPVELGYRQRARLHLSFGARPRLGFLRTGSHDIHEIGSCLVLEPELEGIRTAVSRRLPDLAGALDAPGRAELLLDLPASGRATAFLLSPPSTRGALGVACELLLDAHPAMRAVAAASDHSNAAAGEDAVAYRRGTPEQPDRWPAWHSPGGFLQASRAGNELLIERVLEAVGPDIGSCRVLELHGGSGNFALPVADAGARVTLVERDAPAVANAGRAAEERGVELELVRSDAKGFLTRAKERGRTWDLVLLDPPRVGARDEARRLAGTEAARVVYVSCDAATFARDAATLSASGFRLVSAEPLLLFPQTAHFETVGVFER